jgi:hypothetical protein
MNFKPVALKRLDNRFDPHYIMFAQSSFFVATVMREPLLLSETLIVHRSSLFRKLRVTRIPCPYQSIGSAYIGEPQNPDNTDRRGPETPGNILCLAQVLNSIDANADLRNRQAQRLGYIASPRGHPA